MKSSRIAVVSFLAAVVPSALGNASLIARGSLSGLLADQSGLGAALENGVAGNVLGGTGSGLAWAGGNAFLALPDRGPNGVAWNAAVDDTTSYISRFQTLSLRLSPGSGALPFDLVPSVIQTTLLHDSGPLNYGSAVPSLNAPGVSYFTGRSDNFSPGLSTSPDNARLDSEGIRVSSDGRSVFVSDEYGPFVYRFDRRTGERTDVYALPDSFAVGVMSPKGSVEISGNTSGRVANKGMEGLAITPDGATLVGFMQGPLLQDGGDGGRVNRIVTIDVATHAVHQYAYDNRVNGKNFNSSEILAVNDHQFLVLERDGKGLGDNSTTAFKQIYLVDLTGAQDVSGLTGEAALLAKAPTKTLFLDLKAALNAAGIASDAIPAKLEGMAFGPDVTLDGVLQHTLFVANDNDFLASDAAGRANPNQWFVFGVSDADFGLVGASFAPQSITSVPDANASPLHLLGLGLGSVLIVRARGSKVAISPRATVLRR